MFSLRLLKTGLDSAQNADDVLQAFLDARAYGYGDLTFVSETDASSNYPANHVMFETVRVGGGLNDRLMCMFTVIGTVNGVEGTYLGFNPYGGNQNDTVNTMARTFSDGTSMVAAGTILAHALGYDDYVVVEKCTAGTLASTQEGETQSLGVITVKGDSRSMIIRDFWFSSFTADAIPDNHVVTWRMEVNSGVTAVSARLMGWDEQSNNHLLMDLTVRSTDDQNVVDLMGAIQKRAIQTLTNTIASVGEVTASVAAEALRANTVEQAIAAAFETTMAFGPTMKQAANAVNAIRDATGYIPRP